MKLTTQSASRLQAILSKRVGRQLSESELEEAYSNLVGFCFDVQDLDQEELATANKPTEDFIRPNLEGKNKQELHTVLTISSIVGNS